MPPWRADGVPKRWPLLRNAPPNETWDEVRKGERNGVLLLLLTLSWWKAASDLGSEERDEYESALEDVAWLMPLLAREMQSVDGSPGTGPSDDDPLPVPSQDATDTPISGLSVGAEPRLTRKRAADEAVVEERPHRQRRH